MKYNYLRTVRLPPPQKIAQTEYHAVNKTGLYTLALKEWQKKAATDQTCLIFKQVFAEEYHNLVEETEFTSEDTILTWPTQCNILEGRYTTLLCRQ